MPFPPSAIDQSKTEHVSSVAEARNPVPDSDFCIITFGDGRKGCGEGDATKFLPGVKYRFLGRWRSNSKWGDQFAFDTFVIHSPGGETGVIAYLTATCDNIGEKLARKLWDKYGGHACRILREEPATVAADGILTADVAQAASAQLGQNKALEHTHVEIFNLLKGSGIYSKAYSQCVELWGIDAPSVIRRDPFKLMGMPGAGFKRCDKLWMGLGLPPLRLKRQLYASMEAIRNDRTGHTWLSQDQAKQCCVDAVGSIGARPDDALELGIRARRITARQDGGGALWITLAQRQRDEQAIAFAVRRLCHSGKTNWPVVMAAAGGESGPSDHQLTELRKATALPVGIFIGGPGSGKTHTLSYLLRDLVESHGSMSVAVCAPTGKAANRATQSLKARGLDIRATTIHSLLGIKRKGGGGDADGGFDHDRDNPLFPQFIIVDETSMVNTSLMARLIDACAPGLHVPEQQEQTFQCGELVPARCLRCHRALRDEESKRIGYGPECRKKVNPAHYRPVMDEITHEVVNIPYRPEINIPGTHILFIGDPYQLPPVGHGAPLRDMIAAGIPVGELTEIRRNAGRIVSTCKAIKEGRPIEWSPTVDLAAGENLRLIDCPSNEVADVLSDVMGRGIRGFHSVWQTQVIVAMNDKGDCSRAALNNRLQKLLNPDGTGHAKSRFRTGDKIICLKNTWLKPCAHHLGNELDSANYRNLSGGGEVFTANGEIGRIVAVGPDSCVAQFGESPTMFQINTKGKPDDEGGAGSGESSFDLAYAVTCHKLQGSSAPCVVIVADDAASGMATFEWWYTAFSRGESLVVVIGPGAVVAKQAAKVATVKRKTFLKEAIVEAIQGGQSK